MIIGYQQIGIIMESYQYTNQLSRMLGYMFSRYNVMVSYLIKFNKCCGLSISNTIGSNNGILRGQG